jgi:hypothetical protein
MNNRSTRFSATKGSELTRKTAIACALFATLPYSQLNAQENAWSGLARSQFDSNALTLRIPCVVLEDEIGNSLPGFSPAFAMNLLLMSDDEDNQFLRFVEPFKEFLEVPTSCLDTLKVSSDGTTATYSTNSAELDIHAAVYANRYYTIELQTNLEGQGPIDFSVVSAESRIYQAPRFRGESLLISTPAPPFVANFIYDKSLIDSSRKQIYADLAVYEPSTILVNCSYLDPLGLLELVDGVNGNSRYRLKSTLTAANNNTRFSLRCNVFNGDLNRHVIDIDIMTWIIQI